MDSKTERRKDKYLRYKYYYSLSEYNVQLKKQKYRCASCRWKPSINKKTGKKHLALAVDHWHKLANLKIKSYKKGRYWKAKVIEFPDIFSKRLLAWIRRLRTKDKVRRKALKKLKRILMKKSRRGLLCWHCNTAIQKFRDNPVKLIRAGRYIQKYTFDGA